MGFFCRCLVVTGKTLDEVCSLLSVTPSGEHEEFPESDFAALWLDEERLAIWIEDEEAAMLEDELLKPLSQPGSAVSCYVDEGSMSFAAYKWVGGKEVWSVTFIDELECSGALPKDFESMRAKAQGDSESELPVEAFVADGGYRYDSTVTGPDGAVWEVLTKV